MLKDHAYMGNDIQAHLPRTPYSRQIIKKKKKKQIQAIFSQKFTIVLFIFQVLGNIILLSCILFCLANLKSSSFS